MALFLLRGRFFKRRTDITRVAATIHPYCSSVVSGRKHINGVDLYYEQRGRGKEALLFFPGVLGCTKTSFGPQIKSLNKDRFTLVSWDPRGYGQSRPPARDFPPDFFERDAKDGVDLMKALGFDKFSVLGWSAGGTTAVFAAAKNPDLIHRLVVCAAITVVSQEDVKIHKDMRDVSKWSPEVRKPQEDVYGVEVFAKTWALWTNGITQFAKRPEGSICLELLPLISCPTLILHGVKDKYVPFRHPQNLFNHIKGSRLHLMPDGKHSFHLKYADEFNKVVEDFLED